MGTKGSFTSKYTDEQKAEFVAIVREVGLAEAARRTGVSKTWLYELSRKAGVNYDPAQTANATAEMQERRERLREEIRTKMLEKAHDLLGRMDKPHVEFKGKDADQVTYPIAPAGAVKDYAIAFAVLLDKYRLEVGEATGRTESRSLTDGLDDHEKRKLRDWIDSLDLDALAADAEGDPQGAGSEVR